MWLDVQGCFWGDGCWVALGTLPWSGDQEELGFWLLLWVLVLMPEMFTDLLWCLTQHHFHSAVKDRGPSIFHIIPTLMTLRASRATTAYLLLWGDNWRCILHSWKDKLLSPVLKNSGGRRIACSMLYNIKNIYHKRKSPFGGTYPTMVNPRISW